MARGQGQIVRQTEGRWRVRWFVGRDASGRRRYKSHTVVGNKRDAQRYLNRILRSQDDGSYVEPGRLRVNELLDKWLEIRSEKVSARTIVDYRKTVERYVRPHLGSRRLDSIRLADIQDLVTDLQKHRTKGGQPLSARTIRLALSLLGSAFTQGVRLGLLHTNPAQYVELPREQRREMLALSREEIHRFRDTASGDPHALLYDFALATGARPGEILAVKWSDLDPAYSAVTIRRAVEFIAGSARFKEPKTPKSRRTIPIPPSVVAGLREHRAHQAQRALEQGKAYARALDLVFANDQGRVIDPRNLVQRSFKPILKAAKLPHELRLYDLRHTCATIALAEGVNVKVVSERLGHASARMTLDVYAHTLPGMQESATQTLEAARFGEA